VLEHSSIRVRHVRQARALSQVARAARSGLSRQMPGRPFRAQSWQLGFVCLALVASCQKESTPAPGTSAAAAAARPAAAQPAAPSSLVVFAAASLRDVFGTLRDEFVHTHPGLEVTFNFAGTQELRAQLEHGAKVDVFASADQRNMNELSKVSRVLRPVVFARNEPVLVVAKERAALVPSFADLPKAARIVLGVPDVPIGRYTLQILDRASNADAAHGGLGKDFRSQVEAKVVSREPDVRQVLAKVSLGEADAAIVYRTDANAAKDKLVTVSIPDALNVLAEYPIAVVSDAEQATLASEWVKFITSSAGQALLHKAGFLSPAEPSAELIPAPAPSKSAP
jgi:molybdate transport system substrate-binding protein